MKPLCVDLDGTLIATDTLWESMLLLLKQRFFLVFLLPLWLLKGKAYLKDQIAQCVTLDVTHLPYREKVLAFLRQEKDKGRLLVLATATHHSIAKAVASHLKLFDEVIASDVQINMKGTIKRDALKQRFEVFDYIGDSKADLPILQAAQDAFLIVPCPSPLLQHIQCPPERRFSVPKRTVWIWFKALRSYQWVKNLLIFLPLVLSHQLSDVVLFKNAVLAFIAFSLMASSGYVLNDLLDLTADRAHPSKKYRPFAAGQIPIQYGLVLFIVLVSLSLFISLWQLSLIFTIFVVLYLLFTISYSFYFKHKLVTDVIILAGLYTLRILAGGFAVDVPISSWLLAFSMFIFTSLAFLKRYLELLQPFDATVVKNRDYEVADVPIIGSAGLISGYLAVLVFALYIDSETVTKLYRTPFYLWIICPILLYWITRIWFLARRQKVLDDPVQFALTDNRTWLVMIGTVLLILLAKFT